MNNIKNVLLDFDGTLISSAEGIFWAFEQMFRELGRDMPSRENLAWAIGPGAEEVFRRLFQNEGETAAMDNLSIFRRYYNSEGLLKTKFMEGGVFFLEELQKRGIKIFLTTMKGHIATEKLVDYLEIRSFFSGIYGNRGQNRKIELIQLVMETEKLSASETVIIGDTLHDVDSGKELKLATVAVSFGYGKLEELKCAQPDFLVGSFEEALSLICPS